MPPTIALIGGTGRLGPGLALRLARAGRPWSSAPATGSARAERAIGIAAAPRRGGRRRRFAGPSTPMPRNAGDLAILTVPYEAQRALLPDLAGPLRGQAGGQHRRPGSLRPGARAGRGAGPRGLGSRAGRRPARQRPDRRRLPHREQRPPRPLHRELDEDVMLCGDDEAPRRTSAPSPACSPGSGWSTRAGSATPATSSSSPSCCSASISGHGGRWAFGSPASEASAATGRAAPGGWRPRSLLRLAPCPRSPRRRPRPRSRSR